MTITREQLEEVIEVANCKHCGSQNYQIKLLYVGSCQRLFVVECGDCRGELIPVVVDYFEPDESTYAKCEEAWNSNNDSANLAACEQFDAKGGK